jgi:hypothetical protein
MARSNWALLDMCTSALGSCGLCMICASVHIHAWNAYFDFVCIDVMCMIYNVHISKCMHWIARIYTIHKSNIIKHIFHPILIPIPIVCFSETTLEYTDASSASEAATLGIDGGARTMNQLQADAFPLESCQHTVQRNRRGATAHRLQPHRQRHVRTGWFWDASNVGNPL